MKFNLNPQIKKDMAKVLVNTIFQHTKGKVIETIHIDKDFIDDVFGVGNTVVSQIYARAKRTNKDFTLKNEFGFKNTKICVRVTYYYINNDGNKIYDFIDYNKPINYLNKVSC